MTEPGRQVYVARQVLRSIQEYASRDGTPAGALLTMCATVFRYACASFFLAGNTLVKD